MATILLGWELGEGFGHVQRLLRIGRALAAEGHRLVLALCNVVEPWPLLERDGFPVLQAPYWCPRLRQPFLASSMADVLAVRGWESVDTLLPLVEAWEQLLQLVKPDLIVTDFSPTLCLAAYRALPVVQVGNWFQMPPVHAGTFPILVPGQPPVMSQEQILAVVQEVQRHRKRAVPKTLPAVLAEGDRFPAFFPELDPYQTERLEPIWDPLEPLPTPTTAKPDARFFAYLTADNPNVEIWLTEMALTGYPGTVYLRSAPAILTHRLRLQGLTVLDKPAPLGEMLAESAVIVHHAGSTTANAAFAVGRPQILFPQHLEQLTTARLLSRLGVAVFHQIGAAPQGAGCSMTQILADSRYADAAEAWSRRLQQRGSRPALPAILNRCSERLTTRSLPGE